MDQNTRFSSPNSVSLSEEDEHTRGHERREKEIGCPSF